MKSKTLHLRCTPITSEYELHDLSNAWSRTTKWSFYLLTMKTRRVLFTRDVILHGDTTIDVFRKHYSTQVPYEKDPNCTTTYTPHGQYSLTWLPNNSDRSIQTSRLSSYSVTMK